MTKPMHPRRLPGAGVAAMTGALVMVAALVPVRIFEQNSGEERGGTALGVDRGLITETTGVDAQVDGVTQELPVIDEGYREVSTWLAIYRWLRAVADVTEGLSLNESARVDLVSSDAHSAHLSRPQVDTSADVLIGASLSDVTR